jgi:hypothetical protein
MGTLEVADRTIGVAGNAAQVDGSGLSFYKKYNRMETAIATSKAKAKAEAKTATSKADQSEPQAKAETKKMELDNAKTETEVEGLKSDNRWSPLYHMKKTGLLRMFARMAAGGVAGGQAFGVRNSDRGVLFSALRDTELSAGCLSSAMCLVIFIS